MFSSRRQYIDEETTRGAHEVANRVGPTPKPYGATPGHVGPTWLPWLPTLILTYLLRKLGAWYFSVIFPQIFSNDFVRCQKDAENTN